MALGNDPGTRTDEPLVTATIGIGDITLPSTTGQWQEVNAGEWGTYLLRSRFDKDSNIYMMPIASPSGFQGQSVAFVQMASPTLLWIFEFVAQRWRNSPVIPDPNPGDSNWILLDDHWSPDDVKEGPAGGIPFFAIKGRYIYGHKNPDPKTWRNVTYPRTPWMADLFSRAIPDSSLKGNLSTQTGRQTILQMGIPK